MQWRKKVTDVPPSTEQTTDKLKRIEAAVDAALDALDLWQYDRAMALYYLLTAFEDRLRLPMIDAARKGDQASLVLDHPRRVSYENGLLYLVRHAYRRCSTANPAASFLPFDWDAYEAARKALDVGRDYDLVATSIESAYQKRQEFRTDGSKVTFSLVGGEAIEHEAVAYAVKVMAAPEDPVSSPYAFLELVNAPNRVELAEQIRANSVEADDTHITYTTPPPLDAWCGDLAEKATGDNELPLETAVGGYSVGDYRTFYRYLYRLAALVQAMCAFCGQRCGAVGDLVIQADRSSLLQEMVGRGSLSEDIFSRIIVDLTYDPTLKHTDIFFQPLIEIAPSRYLMSPTVITASNWERNLLRLWALKYSDQYSAAVGPIKHSLAQQVAEDFRHHDFAASANRLLQFKGENARTDVDVAVYDQRTNTLALIEIKWFIETAEAREVRSADAELVKGINQVRTAGEFVSAHPEEATQALFPTGDVDLSGGVRLRKVVIARGHLGSQQTVASDVPILDFNLVRVYLSELKTMRGLDVILNDLVVRQKRAPERLSLKSMQIRVALGGYRFTLPGFGFRDYSR